MISLLSFFYLFFFFLIYKLLPRCWLNAAGQRTTCEKCFVFFVLFFFNKIQLNNNKIEDGQPSTNCSTLQYIKTTRERPPHAVHLRRLEQTNNTLVPTPLSGRPSSASAASSSAHYRLLKNLVRRADKSREQRSFKQGQFTAEHMFFVDDVAASRTIR